VSNNNGGEIGAFLAGFLVGGLVGTAAALLLAPQSGTETREQIRLKSEAVAADIKRRAEELQAQSRVILEEGQKQLTEAVQETKKAAATARRKGAGPESTGAA
jgi:gas vesicle protein